MALAPLAPLVVGLMFNLGKYDEPEEGEPPDAHAELDSETTVLAVADAIRSAGHQVILIEGNEEAYQFLRTRPVDIVFNICEGLRGESRESHIPAILEMLGIPYTGSGVLPLAIALDKPMTKRVLAYHGIPTPAFRVVEPGEAVDASGLRFPLFVKPAHEGSSMGVSPYSVVTNEAELEAQVAHVHRWYRQAALVEEFLSGREFTVGIVGNARPLILPIREVCFDRVPAAHGRVYSYQFKQEWDDEAFYRCPADVESGLAEEIRALALRAYRAVGCVDVGRVDIRLDALGRPQVIEINPLPGLAPGYSDLPRAATAAGLSYAELVNRILEAAVARLGVVPRAELRQQPA